MNRRSACSKGPGAAAFALATAAVMTCGPALAQSPQPYLNNLFFSGVPGYGSEQDTVLTAVSGIDQELGVTVLSRLRPLYDVPGIRVGSFTVRPNLYESAGYNSNLLGVQNSPGSSFIRTNPSVSVSSDWSRNRVGAYVGLDNTAYLEQPTQTTTNVSAALGTGITIGRDELILAYSHQNLHQSPYDPGAAQTSTPVPYQVDDVRTSYTFNLGRTKITPNLELTLYRFGNAMLGTQQVSMGYRDSNGIEGGVTARYDLAEQRSIVVIAEGIDSERYKRPLQVPTGIAPSQTSRSFLTLAGLDYQVTSAVRFRLLAGFEVKSFQARQYGTITQPIAEADAIWTPTGLTTLTASIVRTLDNPVASDSAGLIATFAQLEVDHELYRNVLLQGIAAVTVDEYLEPTKSTGTNYSLGASATYLLNRNMRLTAQYLYTSQGGQSAASVGPMMTTVNGNYAQHLAFLMLQLSL